MVHLPDPIGKTREKRELDLGFVLEKVSFPLGVIGMIFEARPDAFVQIAGLSLRSGNGVILKGEEMRQSFFLKTLNGKAPGTANRSLLLLF